MVGFHASRSEYKIGEVIRVPDEATSYAYELSLKIGKQWREDALERSRNGRAASRRTAVYAANTPGNAARFLVSQSDKAGRPVLVYEVAFAPQTFSPMVLIGYIDSQGPEFPSLPDCMEEYWAPRQSWEFVEFVCPLLTVTACLGVVAEEEIWRADGEYANDRALTHRLWGRPTRSIA